MGQGKTAGAGGQKVGEGKVRLGPVGDEPDLRNALGLQLPQAPGGATEGSGVCLDGHGEYAVLLLGLVGDTLALRVGDPVGSRLALRHRLGGHLTSVPGMIALLAFDGSVRCVRIDILTGLVYLDESANFQIRGIGGDFVSLRCTGAAVADSRTFVPVFICRTALHLHLRVTGNRDIAAGTANSAADTGTAEVAPGRNLAALDGNALAAAYVAAADTCPKGAADGVDLAAGDGNAAAVADVAAADTGAVFAALGSDLTVGDGNAVAAVAAAAAANTGTAVAAVGCNIAAGDGDPAAVSTYTAADACGIITAGGVDCTVGDSNITAVAAFAAADAGSLITACGRDLAACDLNIRAAAAVAAADACGIAAAVGCDIAAGNCNIAGIFGAAVTAAADSGTVFAASGDNSSAGDGDIIAFTSIDIAADARTAFTAGGIQAAGAPSGVVTVRFPAFPLCTPAWYSPL